jgi:CheY-like chemotaxis protein
MPRVLVAEDEMLLALTLRQQLEHRGYEVVAIAHNGAMAVTLCRETQPDAILMDIRMPVMDGLEATRRIMAECPTCVVVLTALDSPDTLARAEEAGAVACIMKPASIDEIDRVVEAGCRPRLS